MNREWLGALLSYRNPSITNARDVYPNFPVFSPLLLRSGDPTNHSPRPLTDLTAFCSPVHLNRLNMGEGLSQTWRDLTLTDDRFVYFDTNGERTQRLRTYVRMMDVQLGRVCEVPYRREWVNRLQAL